MSKLSRVSYVPYHTYGSGFGTISYHIISYRTAMAHVYYTIHRGERDPAAAAAAARHRSTYLPWVGTVGTVLGTTLYSSCRISTPCRCFNIPRTSTSTILVAAKAAIETITIFVAEGVPNVSLLGPIRCPSSHRPTESCFHFAYVQYIGKSEWPPEIPSSFLLSVSVRLSDRNRGFTGYHTQAKDSRWYGGILGYLDG